MPCARRSPTDRTRPLMKLALGTVQFGLPYGVAGRDAAVPEREATAILERAHAWGIRCLDTAAAYGDIEARLVRLVQDRDFRVISKLPALPAGSKPHEVESWVRDSIDRSRERLGNHLDALLFHRAEDLLDIHGDRLWAAASAHATKLGIKLGVSCYGAATLAQVRARYPVQLAQVPGNAFDQSIRTLAGKFDDVEIHLRSAFLQGLLLMPEEAAARRVPPAAAALGHWHAWCRRHHIAPLNAALAIAKGLPGASHCVVGVDDLAQFEAIAVAWRDAAARDAPELAVDDERVVDPRCWRVAA